MRGTTAPVRRIIRFSSVDGDGNRTAVFLQGCNFNCRYCHNPETRALPKTLAKAGAPDKDSVLWMDADGVFLEIRKQMPYIRGVTVSGGECMLYPEFLTALFTLCKAAGLHTLIDTNGAVRFADHPALLRVTDGVMPDVKAWDATQHRALTDADNAVVKENLSFLAAQGKLFEVRTVVVPDAFDARETIREVAGILRPFREQGRIPVRYKLITYRARGVRKEYLGYRPPTSEEMQALAAFARAEGMEDVIVV